MSMAHSCESGISTILVGRHLDSVKLRFISIGPQCGCMDLVLDKKKGGGRHKSQLQKRFEKLRSAVERQSRRNTRFRKDLDELVEIFHRRSTENDKVVFDDLVALSGKLIIFAGRKSLSDWHRRELDDWLRDLIERRLFAIDREVAERLLLDYQQAIAGSMGISLDELVGLCEAESEGVGYGFHEQDNAEQPDDMEEGPWQEDLFGFDDFDPEAEAFDDAHKPDWIDDEEEAHIGRTVMDGSWAKDLFRRAAQALHPDREADLQRRQVKEERMRELLRARKQGDIMAMLTIYSESVGGADIVVAEREMTEICDALEHQLEELELEKHGYIYAHPVRNMVFDLFYHSTSKVRKRRLREWEEELKHEGAHLRDLVAFLRNLTCLKKVLEDRRDERAAMIADAFFEGVRF